MTPVCRQYGNNGGAPLVLVHGFLCAGEFFSPNIRQLKKQTDIITVDLPGFGESAKQTGETSIGNMARQLLAALDKLQVAECVLLGHSMGGMVALKAALLAPRRINRLVLYATNSDGVLPDRFETFAETKARLRADLEEAKKSICATWFCAGARHRHFPLVLRCAAPVRLQTAVDAVGAMENFNETQAAATLATPTLVIGAEKDRTYTPPRVRALQARIPQARLQMIKNAAHAAHLEAEEEFNALLLEWLAAD